MRCRSMYGGGITLLLTLGCGSVVEIGHGAKGGAGAGAQGNTAGGRSSFGGSSSAGSSSAGSSLGEGGEAVGVAGAVAAGGQGPVGAPIPADDGPQAEAHKLDLLLAIDNSITMADKQRLLGQTLPELLKRLVNPPCVNGGGGVVSQPATPEAPCAAGSQREIEPLRDVHVGVITSSLGSRGLTDPTAVCTQAGDDDRAHLVPLVRSGVNSYAGKGFLKWDPDGLATPAGESDVQAFADSLASVLASVGESGCGHEAQLESVYRFLVDPDPPQSILIDDVNQRGVRQDTDTALLQQRESFLRPDSSVVVLMLTDENDCSVVDENYGWLVGRSSEMFRSTSACASDPNSECCQSCGETVAHVGCPPIDLDAACQDGRTLPADQDSLNLRCFDQKRRFGFDLLHPVSRYVSGFGDGMVPDRAGNLVPNPLFHRGAVDRDRSLITFAMVGGVPWQDIATTASLNGETLEYMTPAVLEANGRWPVILGDPASFTPPTDPFMRESMAPRTGRNPILNVSITPSSSLNPKANPLNGHEQVGSSHDLQYACTFELPQPRQCDQAAFEAGQACDCFAEDLPLNRATCNPPGGGPATTTQYYAKAYPALRELAVARELGRRTVLGSVCSRNVSDDTRSDYGYRPVFSSLNQRIARTLVKP